MKSYEDPQQYLDRHIKHAAEKYHDGLQKAGLKPNPKLTKAMTERAVREAQIQYIREAGEIRDQNIACIRKDLDKQVRLHWRRRRSQLLLLHLPIVFLFGFMAWFSFFQAKIFFQGVMYGIGSLAFLAILLIVLIVERPKKRRKEDIRSE